MMLRCSGLTLAVPGRVLCRELDASFGAGEVWAVLGRNGTGKTTLLHALAGLARPAAGRIELEGERLETIAPRSRAQRLGVLLQLEEGTYWGSVEEYVLLGRFPHVPRWARTTRADLQAVRASLEAVGMAHAGARRYASLSGGERQRVRIAQILAQAPRIFLMDEPLQHLDLAHQARVLALVAARAHERGDTIVMVLHEPLWISRRCSHALVFGGDGRVELGRAETMLTLERLEQAYGCTLREVGTGEGRCFVPHV